MSKHVAESCKFIKYLIKFVLDCILLHYVITLLIYLSVTPTGILRMKITGNILLSYEVSLCGPCVAFKVGGCMCQFWL